MYNVAVDCGYFYFLCCLHLNFVKVFFGDVVSSSSLQMLTLMTASIKRFGHCWQRAVAYLNNDFVKTTFSSIAKIKLFWQLASFWSVCSVSLYHANNNEQARS